MPAWEAALGGERGVDEVAQYVLSLSGRATISELASKGKTKYEMFCVACHGADGTGNTALGAPNLTDDTWLYGGSLTRICRIHCDRAQRHHAGPGRIPRRGQGTSTDSLHIQSFTTTVMDPITPDRLPRSQQAISVLWPSFIMAIVASGVFFSAFKSA